MLHSSAPLAVRFVPAVFVVLWSTGFIGAKYGLPYAEPFTFLSARMILVAILFLGVALVTRPGWLTAGEIGHSMVAGTLLHGVYLGGIFLALGLGMPAGISALVPGLQPVLTTTIASRFLGERVTLLQWLGVAGGLVGVMMVLQDRQVTGETTLVGWLAIFAALLAITLGSLYQKRYCTEIDWRAGNFVQYGTVAIIFTLVSFLFETKPIDWQPQFIFALAWIVIMLSFVTIGLMYWMIRRSSATQMASLFYLVPTVTAIMAFVLFDERLSTMAIAGMVICAVAVMIVNRRQ